MKRCLVIDDAQVVRKVARAILESIGYEVTEAENAKDAIAAYKAHHHDAVLLDWQLNGTTGIDVLGALRPHMTGKRTRVIYCITENDFNENQRAKSAGADDILLKPFDRAMLVEKFNIDTVAA